MNGLLNLFANIIVFGFLLWVINRLIPLPSLISRLLNILVLIILIIFVLQHFNLIQTHIPMYHLLK